MVVGGRNLENGGSVTKPDEFCCGFLLAFYENNFCLKSLTHFDTLGRVFTRWLGGNVNWKMAVETLPMTSEYL